MKLTNHYFPSSLSKDTSRTSRFLRGQERPAIQWPSYRGTTRTHRLTRRLGEAQEGAPLAPRRRPSRERFHRKKKRRPTPEAVVIVSAG